MQGKAKTNMNYKIISSSLFVPKPGVSFGPCLEKCHHRDCAFLRSMVVINCVGCQEPIGYETEYYRLNNQLKELIHKKCINKEKAHGI